MLAPESGLKWWLRKTYYSLAHGLLLYSEHEADLLRNLGFSKPTFVVGNSNFSDSDLDNVPASRPKSSSGLCYVGRISADKGLSDFVRFACEHPDRKVVLVGPSIDTIGDGVQMPRNLTILSPEYELDRLRDLTADCGTMIMFTPAGLSLFTAAFLGKRIVIKRICPQKPEYYLLQAFDLIELFEDYEELRDRIERPSVGDQEYHQARAEFLKENSAEAVASRLLDAYSRIEKSNL